MLKGTKMSLESRQKLSNAHRGRIGYWTGKKHSQEYKEKMSLKLKGKNTWLKGKKLSEEHKNKIAISTKKVLNKPDIKLKMSVAQKGKSKNEEWNKKNSLSQMGEKNHNWQGGKTNSLRKLRNSREYKLWRTAVFTRDNFTCIWCGFKGYIQADHIKPFAHYPELHFAIDNGRTLCVPCHKKTDTYGSKLKK